MVSGALPAAAYLPAPPEGLALRDYLQILRRRKGAFLLPAVLVLVLAAGLAVLWPPTWRSEATILIEDAEIPEDLIGPLVSDYIEKRLESIDRRVMTSDSLLGIIERYDLYPVERHTRPMTEVIDTMRGDIGREMIRANIVDPKSGQRKNVSVAFKLVFAYGQAATAQKITNELVTLYLNENLRQRRELTADTAGFLKGERERVEQEIREVDARLAAFKREHAEVLPERLPYNQQLVARAELDLRDLDRQLQSLRERDSYLTAQLAQLEPFLPDPAGGLGPAARLEALRAELASLTARYGGTHPDVVRTRREVEILERSVGPGGGRGSLQQDRARAAAELAVLRQRYTDDHPDVRKAQRELTALDDALRVAGPGRTTAGVANPAYVTLQAQLAGIRTDLEATRAQRQKVAADLAGYQELLLRTPQLEGAYAALQRELQDLASTRQQIAAKETSARLGQAVETGLKAERLSLIEPPSAPVEPVSPNRKLILLAGLVLALACGAGLVALRELLDEAVWGPRDVARLVGPAPLAVVPRIDNAADRWRRRATAGAAAACAVAVLGAGLWLADHRYGPLDVFAYELQRRAVQAVGPWLPGPLQSALDARGAS